jgi:hypothetical protein
MGSLFNSSGFSPRSWKGQKWYKSNGKNELIIDAMYCPLHEVLSPELRAVQEAAAFSCAQRDIGLISDLGNDFPFADLGHRSVSTTLTVRRSSTG